MEAQEIWIIGTEPPCPRCEYLTLMVKDIVSELRLPAVVRHLSYTGEEARRLAAESGLEPGTAKDVARRLPISIDWEGVNSRIGKPVAADGISGDEPCCATMADRWSPELDELLHPCEIKAKEAGIMMTPVLALGGRCVHQGSVPRREQVIKWIRDFCGCRKESVRPGRVVEVLGTSCAKCDQLYSNVQDAVTEVGLHGSVEVRKRTDVDYFRQMGVAITPALVIDGQVQSKGRVLTAHQIRDLLQKRLD